MINGTIRFRWTYVKRSFRISVPPHRFRAQIIIIIWYMMIPRASGPRCPSSDSTCHRVHPGTTSWDAIPSRVHCSRTRRCRTTTCSRRRPNPARSGAADRVAKKWPTDGITFIRTPRNDHSVHTVLPLTLESTRCAHTWSRNIAMRFRTKARRPKENFQSESSLKLFNQFNLFLLKISCTHTHSHCDTPISILLLPSPLFKNFPIKAPTKNTQCKEKNFQFFSL